MIVASFIVGVITLIATIISLWYSILNVEHPQIACEAYTGHSKIAPAKITLKNIGDTLTIIKVNDTQSYLNPYAVIIPQQKWKTDDEFNLCLIEGLTTIPDDFKVDIIVSNKSNKMFLCKVTKGINGVDIQITRRFCLNL